MRKWFPAAALVLVAAAGFGLSAERELFNQAETRFAGGNFSFALEAYDQFLAAYPLSELVPDAQFRRGVALYQLTRYRDALSVFESVQRRYRGTRYLAQVPFWAGVTLYRLGEFDRAAFNLEQFVAQADGAVAAVGTGSEAELSSQFSEALLYQAMSLHALASWEAVETTLTRLLDREIDGLSRGYATALLAEVLGSDGRVTEVLELTDDPRLGSFPEPWRSYVTLYRAEALWALERFGAASEAYRGVLDSSDDVASTAYRRLFIAARREGNFDEMERLVQRAETRFASSPEVLKDFWLRLGIESFNRGNLDLAEHFLDRVWQLRADETISAAAPLYLAETYRARDDENRARAVLESFIDEDRDRTGEALMRLGDIELEGGQFAAAAAWYGRYLHRFESGERRREAGYLAAYSHYRAGDLAAARDTARAFIGAANEPYLEELLRLTALIERRQGNLSASLNDLNRYASLVPRDVSARVDRLKVLFELGRHRDVIVDGRRLLDSFPDLQRDDRRNHLLASYLLGLALVAERRYEEATPYLAVMTVEAATANGLRSALGHAIYYRAWTLYRLGRFAESFETLTDFGQRYPGHPLGDQAAYLRAWDAFSSGDFETAYREFGGVAFEADDSSLVARAAYLAGKSAANRGNHQAAVESFELSVTVGPRSPVADDALFERGEAYAALGSIDQATASLRTLITEHPRSLLVEEASYRIGEILFEADRYPEARDAFADYRNLHPEGDQIDSAYYWGAVATSRAGEPFGAVLLWEQLIVRFPESPFRPVTLQLTAEAYVDRGDYRTALPFYIELIAAHPEDAEALGANRRVEEVRLLILGLSAREAELSATISRTGGAGTRSGREAILELARIYIFETTDKAELGYQMLGEVTRAGDPSAAARAEMLIGEYFAQDGQDGAAADAFLRAASANPADRDLSAAAIYRAAEMAARTGNRARLRQLVSRLTEQFGETEWASQATRLLQGGGR